MKQQLTPNQKALMTVWAKGWAAASEGKPAEANPYPWRHEGARSTFAGVWYRHWHMGWEAGADVRRVLRWLWKGGKMNIPMREADPARLTELGGKEHLIHEATVVELKRLGLIERGAKSPMSERYHWATITDTGLQLIDVPTKAAQASVEVHGVDHRQIRGARTGGGARTP